MDKLPRFAKVFAGRRRIVEMDISLRLRNLAEFFNSLLDRAGKDYRRLRGSGFATSRHQTA
jgi:hypothetical protein